jgi:uncharacterized protein
MRYFLPAIVLPAIAAALLCCACGSNTMGPDDLHMRTVKLPNGQEIRAEAEIDPVDMQKGMMFRDSIARGHGMLFIHDKPGFYQYWMYQVRIPLDIIWMDSNHRVVEISADTPPCQTKASECPKYGGHQQARFALELGGGEARRLGIRVGDTLDF